MWSCFCLLCVWTIKLQSGQLQVMYVGTPLNPTPILEWYTTRLAFKNGHQKTCVTTKLDNVLNL